MLELPSPDSDFGSIAPHTRLNGVGPEGPQSRHAMRAIIIAIERTIGGDILHVIKAVVDPVFHGNGPCHIGGVRLHGPRLTRRRRSKNGQRHRWTGDCRRSWRRNCRGSGQRSCRGNCGCLDCYGLTSDFGPIAPHTRFNGVGPEGPQSRHAMRAIIIAIEWAIGSDILHVIKAVVDPVFHGNGPRHIGGYA